MNSLSDFRVHIEYAYVTLAEERRAKIKLVVQKTPNHHKYTIKNLIYFFKYRIDALCFSLF